MALAIWGHLWFYINFTGFFFSISVKIVIGIFIEITLKSVDHLGNLNISTILILASHEYGLYCHLFLFNFFHQYLINNSLQRKSAIFHLLWFNALLKPLLGYNAQKRWEFFLLWLVPCECVETRLAAQYTNPTRGVYCIPLSVLTDFGVMCVFQTYYLFLKLLRMK